MTDSGHSAAEPGHRDPAPRPLGLVQRFVNTNDIEAGTDRFADAAGLREWLADAELPAADVDAAGLRRAVELREAIRALGIAHTDGRDDPDATATLNRAAARAGLQPALADDGTLRIEPSAGGLDGALGHVVAAIHQAVADGTWARMKACERDSCRWLFYDHSKNRSGRWCSMGVCGNREKSLRAYRRRQKSPVRPSASKTA